MFYFRHSKNLSDVLKNIFNSISTYSWKKNYLLTNIRNKYVIRKINVFFWRNEKGPQYRPCPSVPMRCTPVASPVNKFSEIVSPVPNYAFLVNKWIRFLTDHKGTLSAMIFGKLVAPTEIEYFQHGPRSWTNFANWL